MKMMKGDSPHPGRVSKEDPVERKILRRIPLEILLLSLAFSIFALILFDVATALLIFAGGAFSAINFIWLRQTISHFLSLGKKKALKSAILLYSLRLLLIIPIFFIIIFFFSKKILAFIVGFSAIIPVFFIEAVVTLSKLKQWKN